MATDRFLGGAWAAVHGPREPRAWLSWMLDGGFAGVMAGSGPRPVDWAGLRPALSDLPVRFPAVRVHSALQPFDSDDGSLASANAGDRMAHVRRVEEAAQVGRLLGCPLVVLEVGPVRVSGEPGPTDLFDPAVTWTADLAQAQLARRNAGRDAALDSACRALYDLRAALPDMELALASSRHVFSLAQPEDLADIFADLGHKRLSYWHDAALACRREELFGISQGEWPDKFDNIMSGMTLGDCAEGDAYLPPGAGGVDYPLLASYRRRLGRPTPVVVELDPAVDPGEIPGVHAFLTKFDL